MLGCQLGGGGGGVNRAPQNWGGGRAQLTGPLISYYKLRNFFPAFKMVIFPPPNTRQMRIFLNPLGALIPKVPFSFVAEFWVRVTFGAPLSVSVGFRGDRQLGLFLGGSSQRAVQDPLPPRS